MSNIEIKKVLLKKDLKKFITFAWKIYEGDKNWVPPLISEKMKLLDKERSPFFEHGDAELFIAYKDRTPAGTIAAIKDDNFINYHNSQTGYFGFFECFDDQEVANALFKTVEDWCMKLGLEEMIGPMNPSTNDECGLLVDGFDRPPIVMMTYNPRYYMKLYENYGLVNRKNLYAYWATIKGKLPSKLEKVAKLVKEKRNIETRGVDLSKFDSELAYVKDVYNAAWSKNWGFVPMTDKELEMLAKNMKDLVIPELVRFAFIDGEPVAFILTLPDYNEILIKLNGKLFPTGFLKFLWYKNKIKNVRLILLGIKEKFRKMGIDSILYYESLKEAEKYGYECAEFSWILEENLLTNRATEMMDASRYKTYRLYGKAF